MKPRYRKTSSIALCAALFLLLGMLSANAGDQFGQPIPPNAPVVKLAEILKNPGAHKDREVVLEGNYGGHCCATDFLYKEGVNGLECYYPGFEVPKGKVGRPMKIHGVVRVRDAAKTGEEAGVHIEAKGVQFK